jgi:hypothetical protein
MGLELILVPVAKLSIFWSFSVKNRQILEILPLGSCKLALTETNHSSLVGVMADSFSAAN